MSALDATCDNSGCGKWGNRSEKVVFYSFFFSRLNGKVDGNLSCFFSIHTIMDTRVIGKKKRCRCTPTFVNLKSNTMKNTMQRYTVCANSARKFMEKMYFYTFSWFMSRVYGRWGKICSNLLAFGNKKNGFILYSAHLIVTLKLCF